MVPLNMEWEIKKLISIIGNNICNLAEKCKNDFFYCNDFSFYKRAYQNNIKSVVAPLGTSFTEEQLKLSWRYTDKPTIMFDGDDAGRGAAWGALQKDKN